MANPPSDYRDSYWTNLSTMMEKKHGLPQGLLVNIVQKGERTNNDKKSNVGAQSVYQIIPSTRQAFLKKYGVDAYASPQAAAEVAALHLKESLSRNKGDVNRAVREYHGGTDPKNWGKVNNAYVGRVLGGDSAPSSHTESRTDRAKRRVAERNELEKPTLDKIYQAYKSGKMSRKESSDYERDVQNGSILLGKGQALKGNKKSADQKGIMVPQSVADAYYNGEMDAQAKDDLERYRKAGLITLPQPKKLKSSLPDFNEQGVAKTQPETYTENSPNYNSLSTSDKALGALETAATLGSGTIGGTIGAAGGALLGIGREIASGDIGSNEASKRIAQTSSQGAQALTYEPRSQGGRQVLQGVGELAEDTGLTSLPPVLGGNVGAVAGTLGKAAIPAATVTAGEITQAAKPIAVQAVQAAKIPINAVKSGASNLKNMVTGGEQGNPLAKMGAAEVDAATRRVAMANELPVPLGDLHSQGTATRNPNQLKFEAETAKTEVGAPLVNRVEERHAGIIHNMDQFNEDTGAQLNDKYKVGGAISSALQKEYSNDRAKTKALYAAADKSDEAKTIVDLSRPVANVIDDAEITLADYLNGTVEGATETIIPTARKLAVHHGIADEVDGVLIPKPATIKQLESFRKDITAKTNSKEGADLRQSSIIKNLVDGHTQPYEGKLYKAARAARTEQAKRWERNSILDRVMGTKRNTDDRNVALEDVVDTIVKKGSFDDATIMKKALLSSGDEGKQAFSELQGALLRDIQEQATKAVAPDAQGRQMVSPSALDKAIKAVDEDGKLELILGKQVADKLKLLNDVSKDLLTLPASAAVNHSNTASAIAAMIDATLMMSTGMPAPVASALKVATSHMKNKKLKQRIEKSLNLDKATTSKKGEI